MIKTITITTKKLLQIAKEAGKVVLDAQYELEELGVYYQDKIPYDQVKAILDSYDIQL